MSRFVGVGFLRTECGFLFHNPGSISVLPNDQESVHLFGQIIHRAASTTRLEITETLYYYIFYLIEIISSGLVITE